MRRLISPIKLHGGLLSHSRCIKPFSRRNFMETPGEREKELRLVFTCSVCSTRSMKAISKNAYTHGVVLARCPGCENLHLIADNLKFFSESKSNIQDIMKEKGIDVDIKTISDTKEILPEDLIGRSNLPPNSILEPQ